MWKKIGIGVGFVVALLAILVGCHTFLSHQGATVQRYFKAVGSGDANGACAILEPSAQAKLELIEQASTCPQAVTKLHDSLSQAQRDSLVNDTISVSKSTSSGSSKTLTLDDNPLHMSIVMIYKHDGHETIADWV
ncbi:hypothetical protein ABH926_010303 [Catenulispora sp. GP43]|uniref:hypothetical protein n=1 Tax=Catenulispora sp. GP43 TaxID=3156263 RepID=UPI003516BBB1